MTTKPTASEIVASLEYRGNDEWRDKFGIDWNADEVAELKAAAEIDTLRQQLARKSQLANRLAFVVMHFWRSRDYWHQRFRWCASYSGKLQERERQRERED